MSKKINTKKITETLTGAALIGGGIVAERLSAKALNKIVAKAKPELINKPVYKYGVSAAMVALGVASVLFAKGKMADKIQSIGLGISASGVHRLLNETSGGRLAGIYAPSLPDAPHYITPSLTNYVALPDIPQETQDIPYEETNDNYDETPRINYAIY